MSPNSPDQEPLLHTDRDRNKAYLVGFIIGVIFTVLLYRL